ncbi:MAG: apolipoprotein N-acyltransferase, partial [Pseudomonadota bacterium]
MITAGSPLNIPSSKRDLFRFGAALFTGSLLPLAFAPFYWWPLAFVLPVFLLWLIESTPNPRQLFFIGFVFGLGYFGFGVYWIYNSLHDFGMAPPIVAGGITALMVLCLSVFPALALLCFGYCRAVWQDRSLWIFPVIWFSMEWFKGWVLTGMPWISLGYSQTDTPLAGYAAWIGVYGISALCLLVSVSLYSIVRRRQYACIALVLLIPFAGWLLGKIEWSQPYEKALKVTLVQGNIPQHLKWRHDQRQNIFNTYWRETTRNWDSDLIVWPETALPGRSDQIDQSVLAPMQQAAIENNSAILTGLVVSDPANSEFFNSAMLLDQDRSVYHKRHLVMFGEYYPMRWLLDLMRNVINIPYSDLTEGPKRQPLMAVQGIKLGLSICFEDVFSRDIMLALPNANILVNLSNDAWFGDSTAPHQHMQIAR